MSSLSANPSKATTKMSTHTKSKHRKTQSKSPNTTQKQNFKTPNPRNKQNHQIQTDQTETKIKYPSTTKLQKIPNQEVTQTGNYPKSLSYIKPNNNFQSKHKTATNQTKQQPQNVKLPKLLPKQAEIKIKHQTSKSRKSSPRQGNYPKLTSFPKIMSYTIPNTPKPPKPQNVINQYNQQSKTPKYKITTQADRNQSQTTKTTNFKKPPLAKAK